jgi:hypothetical protein
MTREEILKTEYSTEFDKLRQDMMAMSFYKYGHVKDNAESGLSDFVESLDIRYQAWRKTRNTEFLADIANLSMMIWQYPQHFGCHYKPTDSKESPGIDGTSVQAMKEWDQYNG